MEFKTQPFAHQLAEFEATKDLRQWCIFWEQGTGKTWAGINTIAHLWYKREINGAVVIAPGGVHLNWITDELPKHMPDDIPLLTHVYKTGMTVKQREQLMHLIDGHDGLSFLTMTYDSAITDAGRKVLDYMGKRRSCIRILDESGRVKTPTTKRAKTLAADTKWFKYNRILSGTPIAKGPFDIYSQVKMVDSNFWLRELEIKTYTAFRYRYGIFEDTGLRNPMIRVLDSDGNFTGQIGGNVPMLVGYKNLPELNAALSKISSRLTKADVLDLPEKLYTARYYEMSPQQRRVYNDLKENCIAFLDGDDDVRVTADLAIVQLLRFQQVLCGYVPVDGEDEPRDLIDPSNNPRLEALMEAIDDYPGKAIVWAVWNRDIDLIMERLKAAGMNPVQYDGRVSEDDRARSKKAFIDGEASHFVGKASVGGEGLTLLCDQVFYYNNSYRLVERLQSEDRAHRIGQKNDVTYVDLICPGTEDESIIRNLAGKVKLSQSILGDEPTEWIQCLLTQLPSGRARSEPALP